MKKEVDPLSMHKYIHFKTFHRLICYINDPKSAPGMTEVNQNDSAILAANCDSEEDTTTQCLQTRRQKQRQVLVSGDSHAHVCSQGS